MSGKPIENPHDYIKNNIEVPINRITASERLDDRLKHISDHIWPEYPYLLTIPSRFTYPLTEQQAAELQRHTHFGPHEQRLQYMSFLATGWDSKIITPVGDWEDEKIDGASVSSRSQKMQSASNTPKVAAKKISMSEYKKRAAIKSGADGTSSASSQFKKEDRPTTQANTNAAQVQPKNHLKRSSDTVEERTKSKDGQSSKEEHQAKKVKPSPNLPAPESKSAGKRPMLDLPPPLSPTLPDFVEKLLARADESKPTAKEKIKSGNDGASRGVNNTSKKPSAQAASLSQDSDSSRKSKHVPSEKIQAPRKSSVSSGKELGRADANKPLTNGTKQLKASNEAGAQQARVVSAISDSLNLKTSSKVEQRQIDIKPKAHLSKIVKLKIPRRIRTDVQRILKLQPRPKPKAHARTSEVSSKAEIKTGDADNSVVQSRPEKDQTKDHSGKTIHRAAEKGIPNSSQTGEKRPRQDDDPDLHPQDKRFKSPVLSSRASGKRPKEPSPTATREETVSTPQGSIMNGTPAAPNSVERVKDPRQTPSDSGGSQSAVSEMVEILRKEQTKYTDLGRTLKKESDRVYKIGQDSAPGKAQMMKFLAMRIEVTLCFMLGYVIGDEIHRIKRTNLSPRGTWGTLFPWLQQLVQQTAGYPHMCGLANQLEAVCLMVAWNMESEQGNLNSDKQEIARRLRRQYDEAQRKFLEGTAMLSIDDLQQEFPRTWRAKSRTPLAKSAYKLTKETLNGDFYLPITSITLPIEAVRAGKNLLGEWCRTEGVEWSTRLNF